METMKTTNNSTVFVTVGTTSFNDLIIEVNKADFHIILVKLGYKNLIVQYGHGSIVPTTPAELSTTECLSITSYRFKDDLHEDFNSSSLIISHGGAGTLLQCLHGSRKVVIVINETLMGNHQTELALTLAHGKHALVCLPSTLIQLLSKGIQHFEPCMHMDSNAKLSYQELKMLFGPHTTAEEAGFIKFKRGNPQRLLNYLEERTSSL